MALVRAGRDAGLHCVPVRMDLRRGAVIAVFHDTIITIGLFSIFNEEISLTVIAALADPGRLLDERYDRDLRSHPRESEAAASGRTLKTLMNARSTRP